MVTYRFYPRADAAQDKIWRDTFDKWGEEQAITYIMGLHEYLSCSAECAGFGDGRLKRYTRTRIA